ncbi:hypothetical protein Y59_20110 [Enterobacter hormaechei]|nr:hypothetical protein Y59_20110 [Enterobacter hormaechei]
MFSRPANAGRFANLMGLMPFRSFAARAGWRSLSMCLKGLLPLHEAERE